MIPHRIDAVTSLGQNEKMSMLVDVVFPNDTIALVSIGRFSMTVLATLAQLQTVERPTFEHILIVF